jgi:hypothetical protein
MAKLKRLERQGRMAERQKILESEYVKFIRRGGRLKGGSLDDMEAGQVPRSIGPFRGRSMNTVEYSPIKENKLRRELYNPELQRRIQRAEKIENMYMNELNKLSMKEFRKEYSMISRIQQKYLLGVLLKN